MARESANALVIQTQFNISFEYRQLIDHLY